MKNSIIIFIFTFFTLALNAQTLGTFTTSVEGGIKGTANAIAPTLELYDYINKTTNNTSLFENITAQTGETANFSLNSYNNDKKFANFTNILTTSPSHLLKVGHVVNGVKANNAASLTGWFGENVDFTGKNITSISVSLKNIKFETVDNWTTFSYEMTITIYGSDDNVAKVMDK